MEACSLSKPWDSLWPLWQQAISMRGCPTPRRLFWNGSLALHPGKLRWNLKMTHLQRKIIFQTLTIVFHVNLQGSFPVGLERPGNQNTLCPQVRQLQVKSSRSSAGSTGLVLGVAGSH